jgi:hypothetical protein
VAVLFAHRALPLVLAGLPLAALSRAVVFDHLPVPCTVLARPASGAQTTQAGGGAGMRLDTMTPEEALPFLSKVRERLLRKMARERAYLDRRAARGIHTTTDEAYEDDQQLEQDLLAILDLIEQAVLQSDDPGVNGSGALGENNPRACCCGGGSSHACGITSHL